MSDWDLNLSYVVFALNSVKNRFTSFSPNMMVFARELNMPQEILVAQENAPHSLNTTHDREAYKLYKTVKEIMHRVRIHTQRQLQYSSKAYNRNIHGPYFEEGDYALIFINCP